MRAKAERVEAAVEAEGAAGAAQAAKRSKKDRGAFAGFKLRETGKGAEPSRGLNRAQENRLLGLLPEFLKAGARPTSAIARALECDFESLYFTLLELSLRRAIRRVGDDDEDPGWALDAKEWELVAAQMRARGNPGTLDLSTVRPVFFKRPLKEIMGEARIQWQDEQREKAAALARGETPGPKAPAIQRDRSERSRPPAQQPPEPVPSPKKRDEKASLRRLSMGDFGM